LIPFSEVRVDLSAKVNQQKALDAYFAFHRALSHPASTHHESLPGAKQVACVNSSAPGWSTCAANTQRHAP
ncbi:hypothetical protein, partial [Salmonella enterica]|uniref:hypothetical protein n=1 Tax=Salmonella enterica TaxID=28901 RepID=UPI00398C2BAB